MNRGQVRYYTFKPPDKRRPVVILTRDRSIDYLGTVTVAPVTSTMRDVPSQVHLTKEDGMPMDCSINLYHLQTVDKSKIGSLITTLNTKKMEELRLALLFALGFDQ